MDKFLRLGDIDVEMLATFIDSRDYNAAYLDPATGEIYPAFDREVLDANGEPVDLDEVDWISIGGSSRAAYGDMEAFADAVSDSSVARDLFSALGGKGSFRRFGDRVHHQPEEFSRAWHRFQDLRANLRAVEWLLDEHLVAGAEAMARIEQLRDEADRTLDIVRGTPRNGSTWYGVRHVIKNATSYEERVTVWQADSVDDAIARAQQEATEYCRQWDGGATVLNVAQAYVLIDPLQDGAEVFSLIRDSDLSPDDYLTTHFSTGRERQRKG